MSLRIKNKTKQISRLIRLLYSYNERRLPFNKRVKNKICNDKFDINRMFYHFNLSPR